MTVGEREGGCSAVCQKDTTISSAEGKAESGDDYMLLWRFISGLKLFDRDV